MVEEERSTLYEQQADNSIDGRPDYKEEIESVTRALREYKFKSLTSEIDEIQLPRSSIRPARPLKVGHRRRHRHHRSESHSGTENLKALTEEKSSQGKPTSNQIETVSLGSTSNLSTTDVSTSSKHKCAANFSGYIHPGKDSVFSRSDAAHSKASNVSSNYSKKQKDKIVYYSDSDDSCMIWDPIKMKAMVQPMAPDKYNVAHFEKCRDKMIEIALASRPKEPFLFPEIFSVERVCRKTKPAFQLNYDS